MLCFRLTQKMQILLLLQNHVGALAISAFETLCLQLFRVNCSGNTFFFTYFRMGKTWRRSVKNIIQTVSFTCAASRLGETIGSFLKQVEPECKTHIFESIFLDDSTWTFLQNSEYKSSKDSTTYSFRASPPVTNPVVISAVIDSNFYFCFLSNLTMSLRILARDGSSFM